VFFVLAARGGQPIARVVFRRDRFAVGWSSVHRLFLLFWIGTTIGSCPHQNILLCAPFAIALVVSAWAWRWAARGDPQGADHHPRRAALATVGALMRVSMISMQDNGPWSPSCAGLDGIAAGLYNIRRSRP